MVLNTEWTVYLIDDDDDDALFFEMAVNQTHSDCLVHRCANGEDFLNKLRNNPKVTTSMVFIDLTLPTLSGIEILRQVRSAPFSSHLPVFILSGLESPGAMIQTYRTGVTGYLLKPVFQDQWTSMIDRAIHFSKKLLTRS